MFPLSYLPVFDALGCFARTIISDGKEKAVLAKAQTGQRPQRKTAKRDLGLMEPVQLGLVDYERMRYLSRYGT
jgi:hypothetical protein